MGAMHQSMLWAITQEVPEVPVKLRKEYCRAILGQKLKTHFVKGIFRFHSRSFGVYFSLKIILFNRDRSPLLARSEARTEPLSEKLTERYRNPIGDHNGTLTGSQSKE